eukprot:scaffold16199_cov36-Cyclotella_meneghiniana.AAC.2
MGKRNKRITAEIDLIRGHSDLFGPSSPSIATANNTKHNNQLVMDHAGFCDRPRSLGYRGGQKLIAVLVDNNILLLLRRNINVLGNLMVI